METLRKQSIPARVRNLRAIISQFATSRPTDDALDTVCMRMLKTVSRSKITSGFYVDERLSKQDQAFFAFVNTINRWLPANPNKLDVVSKLNASYEPLVELEGRDIGKTVANLFDAKSEQYVLANLIRQHKYVALLGKRGSGKTAFVNYWLNNYTKSFLEKEMNIFWTRIDASKIYDMWLLDAVDKEKCNLSNYSLVHTVFVFLQYCGFLKSESEHLLSDQLVMLKKRIEADPNGFNGTLLHYAAESINNRWKQYLVEYQTEDEMLSDSSDRSAKFIAEQFYPGNETCFENFEVVFDLLREEIVRSNLTVLSIIDGVDNISWTQSDTRYTRMCVDIPSLIDNFEEWFGSDRTRYLLCSRPETIPEIEKKTSRVIFRASVAREDANMKEEVLGLFVKAEIVPPRIQDIIQKKIQAFSDIAFEEEKTRAISEMAFLNEEERKTHFDSLATAFSEQAKEFVRDVGKSVEGISRLAKRKYGFNPTFSTRGDDIVEVLFNYNIRDLLENFIKSLVSTRVCADKGVLGAQRSSRRVQYMLLNGGLYLDSEPFVDRRRYDRIPKGEVFPNIFWYDAESCASTPTKWHGLCGLRLLQLVRYRPVLQCSDVMNLLSRLFGYRISVIIECVEAFVAYGLIEISEYRGEPGIFGPVSESLAEYPYKVSITSKGFFFLEFPFIYPDWLYFMALDTPLHEEYAGSENYIRAHRDIESADFIRNFYDAYIVTVPTFVKHIVYYAQKEKENAALRAKELDGFEGVFPDLERFKEKIGLPSCFIPRVLDSLTTAASHRAMRPHGFAELEGTIKGWQR